MTTKSSTQEIQNFIEENPTWELKNDKLNTTFVFKNFIEAFGFMTQIALIAERSNHHPEWLNVYKTIVVNLTTHEIDGVSERDFKMARAMDQIAVNMTAS